METFLIRKQPGRNAMIRIGNVPKILYKLTYYVYIALKYANDNIVTNS